MPRRYELEAQDKLVKFRNRLRRQQEVYNEKELLAKQAEYVKTQLREREELTVPVPVPVHSLTQTQTQTQIQDPDQRRYEYVIQIPGLPKRKVYRHLRDSSLMQKLKYSQFQQQELEKDRLRVQTEMAKHIEQQAEEERNKQAQHQEIMDNLKELYEPSEPYVQNQGPTIE